MRLCDISSDGTLAVFEEALPGEPVGRCRTFPCDPIFHRIVARKLPSQQDVAELKITYEGFRLPAVAFLPGTRDVLLRGRVPVLQEEPAAFFIWTPESGAIQKIVNRPLARFFEYRGIAGKDLIRIATGGSIHRWNIRSGTTEIEKHANE